MGRETGNVKEGRRGRERGKKGEMPVRKESGWKARTKEQGIEQERKGGGKRAMEGASDGGRQRGRKGRSEGGKRRSNLKGAKERGKGARARQGRGLRGSRGAGGGGGSIDDGMGRRRGKEERGGREPRDRVLLE